MLVVHAALRSPAFPLQGMVMRMSFLWGSLLLGAGRGRLMGMMLVLVVLIVLHNKNL
jgi:hypothetical protein